MSTAEADMLARVFACIDNTTLNATDNEATVEAFCRHTRELVLADGTTVAAVCVYPRFVQVAKRALAGSGIAVASVAGAFPHGQLPIELKVAEVHYAIEQGADEVDVVISRGLLLAGADAEVSREVELMKQACCGRRLKVILETGELRSPTLVERATRLAIDGGADFVKTSTGKSGTGATPEAAAAMLRAVASSGRTVGFKAAGGIRTVEVAMHYARLATETMGNAYIAPHTFRIGASSLTDALFAAIGQHPRI